MYDPDDHEMEFYGTLGDDWMQDKLTANGYDVRLNDGRVDRAGRLVVGGINFTAINDGLDSWEAVQPCYSVQMSESTGTLQLSLLENMPLVRITNSICFSPCGTKMYHCDSGDKEIREFDYDSLTGALSSEAVEDFSTGHVIARTNSTPDGSVTDAG